MIDFICPQTGAPLQRRGTELVTDAGQRYAVVDEIPRFVPTSSYADSFGHEWTIHATTQVTDPKWQSISQERLEGCLGAPLTNFAGQSLLEAGCGAGRFTTLLVNAGLNVHAIDLSQAVQSNRINVGAAPNYRIAQADIRQPPFPEAAFDIVMCLGVLQHTPSPRESLQSLFRFVKPGGMLVVDHYNLGLKALTKLGTNLVRPVVKRLSPKTAMTVTDGLVKVFFPMHYLVRQRYPLQMLLSRISPCQVYFQAFPELSRQQHFELCRLDTFDTLTDYYKWLKTEKQLRRMAASVGATDIWSRTRDGTNVELRCQKPG